MTRKPRQSRIRLTSRETATRRFTRLRSLGCFNEVFQKVIAGHPLREIARFIQKDHNEYTEVTEDSLLSLISDFRRSLPSGTILKGTMPEFFHEKAQEVRTGIDELDELSKLYAMQMGRIAIDAATERKIKKLFSTMPKEIALAREILETSAQLKMDLGLDERHIGRMDVNTRVVADIEHRFGVKVSEVMGNPDSRRKLLGIMERLSTLAPKVIDAEPVLPAESGPASPVSPDTTKADPTSEAEHV